MRKLVYAMGMSLDGYVMGPDGRFDWNAPTPDLFAFATDEVRALDAHLLGRHLYETMRYWEDPAQAATWDEPEHEFAALWAALPKIVFSRTLTQVEGTNTRLASGSLAEEVDRLRAEPGDGEVAIGGPTLAAAAATLGLIDEYRPRVAPVLLGGGTPYYPQVAQQVDLELLDTRRFTSGVVHLRQRVVR